MRSYFLAAVLGLSACVATPKPVSIEFSNTASAPVAVFVREALSRFPHPEFMTTGLWLVPPGESVYRSYACSDLSLATSNVIRVERPSDPGEAGAASRYRVTIEPTPAEAVHVVTVTDEVRDDRGRFPHRTKFWTTDVEEPVLYADPIPFLIVRPDGSATRELKFPLDLAMAGPVPDPTQEATDSAKRFTLAAEEAGGRQELGCSADQIGRAMKGFTVIALESN